MSLGGTHRLTEWMLRTPAVHLADQVLSSGTNLLGVVMVAHRATPQQFGVFSIFLITFFVTSGFNRAAPHAVAMTLDWDDERERAGLFFLPPLAIGTVAALVLVPVFASLDPTFLPLAFLLLPMLLQDAARMHAFALHRPRVALLSDGAWLAVAGAGFVITSSAAAVAVVWAVGGVAGLLVARPRLLRLRRPRRPVGESLVSASLEYGALAGLTYVAPVVAVPLIAVQGVGALQGANVIRGPFLLLVQGLLVHRMAGPPISPDTCQREALKLSASVLGTALACALPIYLLRHVYGPPLLGDTWPLVEPLVMPALLATVLASLAFGPLTAVRKMGRFRVSAAVQGALTPFFVGIPLAAAGMSGTTGFVYGTAMAHALAAVLWWSVIPRIAATRSVAAPNATVA
jgi:hypothetical protein